MTRLKSLPLLIVCIALSGCATTQKIQHSTDQDILAVSAGKPFSPPKDGYWISKFYLNEVMQAQIDEKKKNT